MKGKYKGAKYLGENEVRMPDGGLILEGEVTELLSEEAAMNDNNFEPIYEGEEEGEFLVPESEPEIVPIITPKTHEIIEKIIKKEKTSKKTSKKARSK